MYTLVPNESRDRAAREKRNLGNVYHIPGVDSVNSLRRSSSLTPIRTFEMGTTILFSQIRKLSQRKAK